MQTSHPAQALDWAAIASLAAKAFLSSALPAPQRRPSRQEILRLLIQSDRIPVVRNRGRRPPEGGSSMPTRGRQYAYAIPRRAALSPKGPRSNLDTRSRVARRMVSIRCITRSMTTASPRTGRPRDDLVPTARSLRATGKPSLRLATTRMGGFSTSAGIRRIAEVHASRQRTSRRCTRGVKRGSFKHSRR